MIGSTTSAKPARSSAVTKRDSTRRRRAVSSTSSGRTPVGYLSFAAINQKTPSPRAGEEVWQCCVRSAAPLPIGGAHIVAPRPSVVVMVVVHVSARVHLRIAGYRRCGGVSNSRQPDDVVRRHAGGAAARLRQRGDPCGEICVEPIMTAAIGNVVESCERWRRRPAGVLRGRGELRELALRSSFVHGGRRERPGDRLRKYLEALPLPAEPLEERETDQHPDLICGGDSRLRSTVGKMRLGPCADRAELLGVRRGD